MTTTYNSTQTADTDTHKQTQTNTDKHRQTTTLREKSTLYQSVFKRSELYSPGWVDTGRSASNPGSHTWAGGQGVAVT
jgi:hypothetical protein